MLQFRELESTALYAGLGVRLVDAHTGAGPFGWTRITLDVDDGGTWRPVDAVQRRTAGGVTWFPWLELRRDARGLLPRKYRVRVAAEFSTPRYRYDAEGVGASVAPYDDTSPPAASPPPIDVVLLPAANYPFAPGTPILRGAVVDIYGDRVPDALVTWLAPPPQLVTDPVLITDTVLSDADGEFSLPMRRAPSNQKISIRAQRPPPPLPNKFGDEPVQLPADLAIYQTIKIL